MEEGGQSGHGGGEEGFDLAGIAVPLSRYLDGLDVLFRGDLGGLILGRDPSCQLNLTMQTTPSPSLAPHHPSFLPPVFLLLLFPYFPFPFLLLSIPMSLVLRSDLFAMDVPCGVWMNYI